MAELETAEGFVRRCALLGVGRIAEQVEADRKAVALRVLTDIRDAANAELKGKGLSMSPAEAIANAWHAAFDKYEETAATLTDLQGLDPYE